MGTENMRFAAAYIRVSTEEQVDLSPDSQLEEIRKYAKGHDLVLLEDHVYVDAGISGRKADKRPEFLRMVADAKEKDCPFSVLLLWKFSRFARNQEESIFYKNILRKKCNVEVVSITEPVSGDHYGSLIERIIEWMDEFYSIRLSEEVKRSMTVNAERGVLQSQPPFGYRAVNGVLEIIDSEAETVKYIFQAYMGGKGYYAIAKDLSAMGVLSRKGSLLTATRVKYILHNPVYIGKHRWNPNGITGYNWDSEDLIITDGKHKPIIDQETWDKVQERLDEMGKTTPRERWTEKGLKHWLAGGCIRCSECGGPLIVRTFKYASYFWCSNYNRGTCRSNQSVRVEVLEQAVLNALEEDAQGDELTYTITYEKKDVEAALGRLNASAAQIRKKLERLQEAYLAEVIDLDVFALSRKSLEQNLEKVMAEIREVQEKADPKAAVAELQESIRRGLDIIRSPEASLEEKRRAFLRTVYRCAWNKTDKHLELTYRWVH